ncbi:hypothetical protein LWS69_34265, partial [Bordetella hinzii]|nr:hypothetical protein [Bordetella hinzii]
TTATHIRRHGHSIDAPLPGRHRQGQSVLELYNSPPAAKAELGDRPGFHVGDGADIGIARPPPMS